MTDERFLLATYRLYRSNAIYFAGLKDGYSVSTGTDKEQQFKFEKGEMKQCAFGWLEKSKPYWQKLLHAHAAEVSWSGKNDGDTAVAQDAGSQHEISKCLCPDCTEKIICHRLDHTDNPSQE